MTVGNASVQVLLLFITYRQTILHSRYGEIHQGTMQPAAVKTSVGQGDRSISIDRKYLFRTQVERRDPIQPHYGDRFHTFPS